MKKETLSDKRKDFGSVFIQQGEEIGFYHHKDIKQTLKELNNYLKEPIDAQGSLITLKTVRDKVKELFGEKLLQ